MFAQLIVKGKYHGVKTFMVPLRNPKTYQLLPGIAIGDIGKSRSSILYRVCYKV